MRERGTERDREGEGEGGREREMEREKGRESTCALPGQDEHNNEPQRRAHRASLRLSVRPSVRPCVCLTFRLSLLRRRIRNWGGPGGSWGKSLDYFDVRGAPEGSPG